MGPSHHGPFMEVWNKHSECVFVVGTGHIVWSSKTTTSTITMATSTSKVLSRMSCRLQLLSQTKLTKPSSSPISPFAPRLSRSSRLPVELCSMGSSSMLPLHGALASARLVSSLCVESLGWCLVPQGISMPL